MNAYIIKKLLNNVIDCKMLNKLIVIKKLLLKNKKCFLFNIN